MATRLKKRTVVIVGGGLTAGLISRQLTAKGIEVLVLERGGNPDNNAAEKLPNQRDELRWDIRQGLVQDWAVQTYSLRHSRKDPALPVRRMEAFLPGEGRGGAGNHWTGITWRWAEYDPVLRTHLESRYGKAAIGAELPIQDWGVTYGELESYHDLFEKLLGISGKAGNLNGQIQPDGNPFEAPRRNEYPQPPLEFTEAGLILKATAEKLGYKPFRMAAGNSSGTYTNPDGMKLGACQYCGHCDRFMCEAKAKSTPELLLYPVLLARPQFEIRLNCHVLGVDYDQPGGQVTGVRYVDLLTGEEYEQPADVVVLGAFTMSNAKFLLMAGIGRKYDPATGQGVVGRNFCYQTSSLVNLFFPDRWINPFLAAGCSGVNIDEFNVDNFDHAGLGFFGGGAITANLKGGMPIRGRRVPPGTPRWGTAWKQANADWYSHSFALTAQATCYPHPENFLDLDPTYTDAFGQPLVRMTFDWQENEMRMSEYVTKKMEAIAHATDAKIVGPAVPRKSPFDTRVYQSTHIVGGTVMGTDPRTSVVSPHLQHWDASNLFVVGASVLPHNSGYNPTGPVAALALRLGDDLVRYVAKPGRL